MTRNGLISLLSIGLKELDKVSQQDKVQQAIKNPQPGMVAHWPGHGSIPLVDDDIDDVVLPANLEDDMKTPEELKGECDEPAEVDGMKKTKKVHNTASVRVDVRSSKSSRARFFAGMDREDKRRLGTKPHTGRYDRHDPHTRREMMDDLA